MKNLMKYHQPLLGYLFIMLFCFICDIYEPDISFLDHYISFSVMFGIYLLIIFGIQGLFRKDIVGKVFLNKLIIDIKLCGVPFGGGSWIFPIFTPIYIVSFNDGTKRTLLEASYFNLLTRLNLQDSKSYKLLRCSLIIDFASSVEHAEDEL